MAERARGPFQPLDPAGDRAQNHLGQAEREQDRRHVHDQEVLDHVHDEQLLAQAIDRRDQRCEQRADPGRERRQPPSARGRGARFGPRRPPAARVDG